MSLSGQTLQESFFVEVKRRYESTLYVYTSDFDYVGKLEYSIWVDRYFDCDVFRLFALDFCISEITVVNPRTNLRD